MPIWLEFLIVLVLSLCLASVIWPAPEFSPASLGQQLIEDWKQIVGMTGVYYVFRFCVLYVIRLRAARRAAEQEQARNQRWLERLVQAGEQKRQQRQQLIGQSSSLLRQELTRQGREDLFAESRAIGTFASFLVSYPDYQEPALLSLVVEVMIKFIHVGAESGNDEEVYHLIRDARKKREAGEDFSVMYLPEISEDRYVPPVYEEPHFYGDFPAELHPAHYEKEVVQERKLSVI